MSARDCRHGRQLGKCHECDLADLETENRLLHAHVKRLQREIELLRAVHKVAVEQRDRAYEEIEQLATKVADRLQQSGQLASALLIREVFTPRNRP